MSQRTLSGRITTSGRTLNNDVIDYATLSGSQTLTNKLLSTGCSYQGNPIDQQYLSLTGIVDLNSSQSLTNKSLGSGCSYTGNAISKTHLDNTLVDLNSSQTLTNKEIGSNSTYTGNRINIANLDESIVDKTTSQTVENKTLKNTSLNHNSNQTTNIGTNTQQVFINGHLNVDTNNQRGIVRYINDDNHSIFLRRAVDGTDNTMSFYEFGTIDFYCGNGSNIQFNNMPRRLRISDFGTLFFGNTISVQNSESGSNPTGYAQILFTNNNQPANNFCAIRLTGVNDNSNDKFINFFSDQIGGGGGTDFYTMNLSTGQHDFTSKTAINLVIGSGSSYTGNVISKTYLDNALVDLNTVQSLSNKSLGTGCSYTGNIISKNHLDTSLIDLNASQNLTNKSLGTGCSYTGNVISKTFLDNSLVDLNSVQVVENKSLRGSSLNYNSNQTTLIGSVNQQSYIDGTLNINQNNSRGVIRFANDDNNSIYIKQNLLNNNCMAFYSFSDIFFYTGNNTNLNQSQYPLRMSITHTAISMLVNTIVNGTLSVSSTLNSGDLTATSLNSKTVNVFKNNDSGLVEIFKSNVDDGNSNGTAKLHFTIDTINTSAGSSTITNVAQMGIFDSTTVFRIKNLVNDIEITAATNINLKKNDNTPVNLNFYEGSNFTSLVANNALSSDITVKLPTTGGTLAILADIPEATLPIFIDTTGVTDKITLKGLNGIGSANQIIQVNSSGDGFIYSNLPTTSLTATNPLSINNNVLSLGGLTGFGSANQVVQVNSSGNGFVYGNLPNFSTLIIAATDISTSSILFNPATNIGNTARGLNLNGSNITINSQSVNTTFKIVNTEKMTLSSTILLLKNKMLITNSSTLIDGGANLHVNNSGQNRLMISSESADCLLGFKTVNSSTNHTADIIFRNDDRGLDLTGFQQYNFEVGTNNKFSITDTLTLSKNKVLISADNTSLEGLNANLEVHQSTGETRFIVNNSNSSGDAFAKMYWKSNANFCELNFTNNTEKFSSAGMRIFDINIWNGSSNNSRLTITDTLMTVNNMTVINHFTQINYNNANSFLQLTSNVPNSKVGLHMYQGTSNFQLYLDFNNSNLVTTVERFQITGTEPSIVDSFGRGLIGKATTGNTQGTNVGNAVDNLYLSGASFTNISSGASNGSLTVKSRINKTLETETNKSEYYYKVDTTGFSTSELRGQIFPGNDGDFAMLSHNIHLRLHAGITIGQVPAINANNVAIQLFVSNAERGFMTSSQFTLFVRQDMSRNAITFRDAGDMNHSIIFNNPIDGLLIKGYERVRVDTRYGTAFEAKNDGTTPKLCIPFGTSCNSDDRIKFNEVPITSGLDIIKKLNPVLYNKASELDYSGNTTILPTEYGLIAQDVYNNCPELRNSVNFDKKLPQNFVNEDLSGNCVEDIYNQYVNSDGDTITERDICGFNYDNLHAINIKCIQELLNRVEILEAEIVKLKSK